MQLGVDLHLVGDVVDLFAQLVAHRLPGLEPFQEIVQGGGLPGDALGVAAEAVVGILDLALELEVDLALVIVQLAVERRGAPLVVAEPLVRRLGERLGGFFDGPTAQAQALDQAGVGGEAVVYRLVVGLHGAVDILEHRLHGARALDRFGDQRAGRLAERPFERFHTTLQLGQGRHVRRDANGIGLLGHRCAVLACSSCCLWANAIKGHIWRSASS